MRLAAFAVGLLIAACAAPPEAPASSATASVDAVTDGILRPVPNAPVADRGRTFKCADLYETGWEGRSCAIASTPGGRLVATAERRSDAAAGALGIWRATVYRYRAPGWTVELQSAAEPDAWGEVRTRTWTIDREQVLVVGYRSAGSGSVLSYEIVRAAGSGATVVSLHRTGLDHGAVVLGRDTITEYDADYPNGEPNCCPPRFTVTTLRPPGLQPQAKGTTPTERVPASDL